MHNSRAPVRKLWTAVSLATAVALAGCSGGGSSNTPLPIPALQPIERALDMLDGRKVVPVEVVDAKTGAVLQVPVTLVVHDDDATQDFHEADGLQSPGGLASITIRKGVVATDALPLALRVTATAEGYFVGSAAVRVDDEPDAVQIRLVSAAAGAQPAGVVVATQAGVSAAVGGALQTTISLGADATNPEANGAGATFNLPEGTVLRAADGTALSGDLSVNIAYFSPTTESALAAFPGGLNADAVIDQAGNPASGYFVSGGFLAVDIVDDAGRKAHLLGQNATMTVQVAAGTINPETGNPVQAGDTIPVWSHDEATGVWSQEQTGTLVAATDGSGNFDVSFAVDHLSYWNLDWFSSSRCDPQLNFTGITAMPADGIAVSASFGGYYDPSSTLYDLSNSLYRVPSDRAVTIVATVPQTGVELGRTTVTLGSACPAIMVPIDASKLPPPPRTVTASLTLRTPSSWTRTQVQEMLQEAGATDTVRNAVLNYTHPTGSTAPFVFTEATFAKLKELGATEEQIQKVQVLLALRIKPTSGYLSYIVENVTTGNRDWRWAYMSGSNAISVQVPAGQAVRIIPADFWGYAENTWLWTLNPAVYTWAADYPYYALYAGNAPTVDVAADGTAAALVMESPQFVINAVRAYTAEM